MRAGAASGFPHPLLQAIPDITGKLLAIDEFTETIPRFRSHDGIEIPGRSGRPGIASLNNQDSTKSEMEPNRSAGIYPRDFGSEERSGRSCSVVPVPQPGASGLPPKTIFGVCSWRCASRMHPSLKSHNKLHAQRLVACLTFSVSEVGS